MESRLIKTIIENYKVKSDDELINIYKKNERFDYSEEAFEAIKIILEERNLIIPVQDTPIYERKKRTIIKYTDRYYRLKRNAYIGIIIGLILMLISYYIESSIQSDERMGIFHPLHLLGLFCCFWGFYNYVKRKGYGGEYTLLGIFGIFGFYIMYKKEDLGEAKNEKNNSIFY